MFAHMFEHIAVADGGARERKTNPFKIAFEAEVRHHRGDDAWPRQAVVVFPALRDRRNQLVAIDKLSGFIDDDHPVGIAVEGDADIGAHFSDFFDKRSRRGGTYAPVDIETIRLDANRNDFGAQFPQGFGSDLVRRAISAIDNDAQAIERKVAQKSAFGEFDVAGAIALHPHGAAYK